LEAQNPFCYSIVGGIGVPISIDKDTMKKTYAHFARILVNIDSRFWLKPDFLPSL